MAVARVGIERDVAHDPEIGEFLLEGAHGPADEVVGTQRFAPIRVARRGGKDGKQGNGRYPQREGALASLEGLIDRQAFDARHR